MLRVSLFACLMASVAVMPGYATDFVDAVSDSNIASVSKVSTSPAPTIKEIKDVNNVFFGANQGRRGVTEDFIAKALDIYSRGHDEFERLQQDEKDAETVYSYGISLRNLDKYLRSLIGQNKVDQKSLKMININSSAKKLIVSFYNNRLKLYQDLAGTYSKRFLDALQSGSYNARRSANGELALFNALMEIPDDAAQFIETFRDVGGQLGAEAVRGIAQRFFERFTNDTGDVQSLSGGAGYLTQYNLALYLYNDHPDLYEELKAKGVIPVGIFNKFSPSIDMRFMVTNSYIPYLVAKDVLNNGVLFMPVQERDRFLKHYSLKASDFNK